MQKIIESNLIQKLAHLSHAHKLLYRILWELSDEIGVVDYDIGMVSDAAGIKYHEDDFKVFGNRVVEIKPQTLYLSLYLSKHIKTFNPSNPGQNRIWRRLKERFNATKDDMGDFYKMCEDHGIMNLLPTFPEYHLDENGLKPWIIEYRAELQKAASVVTPYGWPKGIDFAFTRYMQERIERCMKITSKAEKNKNIIDAKNVLALQETITLFMRAGYSDFQIEMAILQATGNNYPTIKIHEKPANHPKPTKPIK